MYTREQYSKYILAVRGHFSSRDAVSLSLKSLKTQGFRFLKKHFRQDVFSDQVLQKTLMNRMLTVVLDVGDLNDKKTVGHMYFKNMPYYNPESAMVEVIPSVGFYPSTVMKGVGEFKEESKRASYKSIAESILLSEEQWMKLGQWFSSLKTKKPSYSIAADLRPSQTVLHCSKFVDLALKTIGVKGGLHAIFSRKQIESVGEENYKMVVSQLAPSQDISHTLCIAEADLNPEACRFLSIKQESSREKMYRSKQANLTSNAVELFIEKADSMEQELSDKESISSQEEDLPPVNSEQLAAAMEGMNFAFEMLNKLSPSWGGEPSPVSQESIQRKAHLLIAYSNTAMAQVDEMISQQRYRL